MKYLVIISLIGLIINGFSQDKIIFKSNEKVYGKITFYEAEGKLVVKRDSTSLTFNTADVSKIKWGKFGSISRFKNKGYFNETSMGFLLGNGEWGDISSNFSILMNQGWMINRSIGLGISTGVETWNSALRFPAIFNARYYFGKGELHPYVSLRGGYMISGKIKQEELIYPDWGYYNYPDNSHGPTAGVQIGFKKSLDKSFGISSSLGFRYQKFTRDNGWNVTYNDMYRFEMRVGLFFN